MLVTGGLFSLENRIALVTGGGRGLGRSLAEALVTQGARVYIASRKIKDGEATAAALGPQCIAMAHDISTTEGCSALAEDIGGREQRLDILVNNAGASWGAPFLDFPEKGWDRVLDLNLRTPFFLTQACHSLLAAGAAGGRLAKVINIASVDALRLNAWESYSYQASKAGLVQLTRRLAARLIRDGICVTAIAPGHFPSDMNRIASTREDELARLIPAGRVGRPEDIAAALVYLASVAGDYVVGHTLVVDGGLVNAELMPTVEI